MLDARNLPLETKIGPYLPRCWRKGENSAAITFKELLTHTAGFDQYHYNGDFKTFKDQIRVGINKNCVWPECGYTNGVFSLIRVLNPIMTGVVPRNLNLRADVKDKIYDKWTANEFQKYVANKIFAPSGVYGVVSTASNGSAFAYSNIDDVQGWESGDLITQLGGAGFRVSINEILDVMGTFRRKGTIVSPAKAMQALNNSLGIDSIFDTSAGKMYLKNGWWGTDEGVEQAVVAFLPHNMEAAIFCNSNLGGIGELTEMFTNAVLNNIE
jgi:Beta-lactamase